jgi:hypothetical protein
MAECYDESGWISFRFDASEENTFWATRVDYYPTPPGFLYVRILEGLKSFVLIDFCKC